MGTSFPRQLQPKDRGPTAVRDISAASGGHQGHLRALRETLFPAGQLKSTKKTALKKSNERL